MEDDNQTVVSEFIFQGLCTSKELQIFLLLPFSTLYLITVVGNLFVVILIITDHHLHSPMYFFLANLSFVDFCLFSVNTPKLITDLLKDNKTISFGGCMSQILCVHFIGGSETVLLVTMAYDRYVAICRPLHYTSIMDRQKKCIWLVLISWIIGFVHGISQLLLIVDLPFCGPRVIDSFFCDIPLVMKLACTNTDTLEIVINADSGVLATTCFISLLISYTYILLTVQLYSKDGSAKALSTCTSHITVVVLFFGPIIFIYLWPVCIPWVDKFLGVFYTVITPFLNPAIYTLRNKDIKNAIKKQINYM
ncbi:Olfactory receptor 4K3 [Microtus ochrogaster]|uniref:Olfactory receptor n=1 Tax=Microtus ochrogaster TaxID=79684 RepID=A0A8J6KWI2_MICOH|nr:Olfactory receptor 4K3 [Microtus ochrogaster]